MWVSPRKGRKSRNTRNETRVWSFFQDFGANQALIIKKFGSEALPPMAATASSNFPPAFPAFSSLSKVKAFGSISFFRPNSTPKSFRLRNPPKRSREPKQVFCVPVVSCLGDNHSEASSELGPSHVTGDAEEATTVDLKLPRRSLLVHFTCNSCGERTQRLINRLAYERGTVFVQCAGCFKHHKLVDNLGLVVEYDLREGSGMNSISDQT